MFQFSFLIASKACSQMETKRRESKMTLSMTRVYSLEINEFKSFLF